MEFILEIFLKLNLKNGGPSTQKGHFFSSTPYITDIIKLSEAPKYLDRSFLHQKYIIEELSTREIAEITFSSLSLIHI